MASGLRGGSLLLSSWPRGSGEGPSFSLPAPGLQMSWAVSASAVRWPLLLGLPSNAVGPPLTRTQGPAHRLLSPRDSAEHPYLLTFFPVISFPQKSTSLFFHMKFCSQVPELGGISLLPQGVSFTASDMLWGPSVAAPLTVFAVC